MNASVASRVRIKMCGFRRPEDVDAAVALGVDMLGFNVWPGSPRYVAPASLQALVSRAPLAVEVVLVFVRAEPHVVEEVLRLVAPRSGLTIQLHGDEDPAHYRHLPANILQVIRVGERTPKPKATTRRVLVDVSSPGFGGSGERIDPRELLRLLPSLPDGWFLAGGLDPDNVAEAIRCFRPGGVDVASGIERGPGEKDHARMARFVANVRKASTTVRQESS